MAAPTVDELRDTLEQLAAANPPSPDTAAPARAILEHLHATGHHLHTIRRTVRAAVNGSAETRPATQRIVEMWLAEQTVVLLRHDTNHTSVLAVMARQAHADYRLSDHGLAVLTTRNTNGPVLHNEHGPALISTQNQIVRWHLGGVPVSEVDHRRVVAAGVAFDTLDALAHSWLRYTPDTGYTIDTEHAPELTIPEGELADRLGDPSPQLQLVLRAGRLHHAGMSTKHAFAAAGELTDDQIRVAVELCNLDDPHALVRAARLVCVDVEQGTRNG